MMNVKVALARVPAVVLGFASIPILQHQQMGALSTTNKAEAKENAVRPTGIKDSRTEFSKTDQSNHGILTTEMNQKRIYYKEGNEQVPIDNTLIEKPAEQTIKIKNTLWKQRFGKT